MARFDGMSNYPDKSRQIVKVFITPTPDCPYFAWELFHLDNHQGDTTTCFVGPNDFLALFQTDYDNPIQSPTEQCYVGNLTSLGATPITGYSNNVMDLLEVRFRRNGNNQAGTGFKIRVCQYGNMCDWFTTSTTTCKVGRLF